MVSVCLSRRPSSCPPCVVRGMQKATHATDACVVHRAKPAVKVNNTYWVGRPSRHHLSRFFCCPVRWPPRQEILESGSHWQRFPDPAGKSVLRWHAAQASELLYACRETLQQCKLESQASRNIVNECRRALEERVKPESLTECRSFLPHSGTTGALRQQFCDAVASLRWPQRPLGTARRVCAAQLLHWPCALLLLSRARFPGHRRGGGGGLQVPAIVFFVRMRQEKSLMKLDTGCEVSIWIMSPCQADAALHGTNRCHRHFADLQPSGQSANVVI